MLLSLRSWAEVAAHRARVCGLTVRMRSEKRHRADGLAGTHATFAGARRGFAAGA